MQNPPEVSFEKSGDFLLVTVHGIFESKWFINLISTIAAKVRIDAVKGIFLDIRKVSGDWKIFDRYLAATAAVNTGLRIPIAIIGDAVFIEQERIGEVVARNRGLDLRVFLDYKEAETWLIETISAK
jgi:hypothetical protein